MSWDQWENALTMQAEINGQKPIAVSRPKTSSASSSSSMTPTDRDLWLNEVAIKRHMEKKIEDVRTRGSRKMREPKHPKEFEQKAKLAAWELPPISNVERSFRHGHWKEKRAKVLKAMEAAGENIFKCDRFDKCGSECTVEYSATENRLRLRANYCKNRHCEPCMRAKANKIAMNLKTRLDIAAKGKYRFVTLTLKHTDQPLDQQIQRLYGSFVKLRAMKLWKNTQRGGAATLEIKYNGKTKQWHPHLHVVCEGSWINKADLSNAWLHATGDSFVTDIRILENGRDAAYYVSKYVTKGTNADVWNDPEAARCWILTTKGLRTCATFGTWRGFKLLANPADATDWVVVDKLDAIAAAAKGGDERSMQIMSYLRPPGEHDAPQRKASSS